MENIALDVCLNSSGGTLSEYVQPLTGDRFQNGFPFQAVAGR